MLNYIFHILFIKIYVLQEVLIFGATQGKTIFQFILPCHYLIMRYYEEKGTVHSFLYKKKINGGKKILKFSGRCDPPQIQILITKCYILRLPSHSVPAYRTLVNVCSCLGTRSPPCFALQTYKIPAKTQAKTAYNLDLQMTF